MTGKQSRSFCRQYWATRMKNTPGQALDKKVVSPSTPGIYIYLGSTSTSFDKMYRFFIRSTCCNNIVILNFRILVQGNEVSKDPSLFRHMRGFMEC